MMIKYTRFFEAKEDYSVFKKGERCELIETNIVYPHELSTCTVLLDNKITEVTMYLVEFNRYFTPVWEKEQVDFNEELKKRLKKTIHRKNWTILLCE